MTSVEILTTGRMISSGSCIPPAKVRTSDSNTNDLCTLRIAKLVSEIQ